MLQGIALAIIGFVFYKPIGLLFTKEMAVLNEFYKVFWVILLMQPFCSLAFIFDGMFKGLGEMKFLRNLLLITTIVIFIPVLLLFDFLEYKLYAIWIAFFLWIIARGVPLIFKFRRKFLSLAQKM